MPIEHDISFPCLNALLLLLRQILLQLSNGRGVYDIRYFSLFFVETIKLSAPKIGPPSAPGAPNKYQLDSKLTFKERFIIQIFQKSETS